jgi:hypothetical protein
VEIASGKCLLLPGDNIIPNNLTMPPRAKAQGAVQKLVARAKTLRIADWVELTLEEGSVAIFI